MTQAFALCALLSLTATSHMEAPTDGSAVLVRHSVEVGAAKDGMATLRVTYAFRNLAPKAQTARYVMTLHDAVVTGLRAKGDARVDWISRAAAGLTVPKIPPGATRAVTVTLRAALSREGGQEVLIYPGADPGEAELPPQVRQGERALRGAPLRSGQRKYTLDDGGTRAGLTHGALRLGERTLWTLRADAPEALSVAPKDARVVFVIDSSASQGQAGLDRQLALMDEVARALPGARFEAVLTDREARAVTGAFTSWDTLQANLRALDPTGHNGSRLDLGLQAALRAVRAERVPWRVIAFTDGLLSPQARFDTLPQAPANGALHVVVIDANRRPGPAEYRDDNHPLAQVALSRGGVLLDVHGGARLREVARQLVRPSRIDDIYAYADDAVVDLPLGAQLREGGRLRHVDVRAAAPDDVALSGAVWSRAYQSTGQRAPTLDAQAGLLGLILGAAAALTDDELLQIAHQSGAVTRLTSRVARRKKLIRAHPARYVWLGLDPRFEQRRAGARVTTPVTYKDVALEVRQAIKSCAPRRVSRRERVKVVIETTRAEIVAVKARGARRADVNACVAQAIWALRLDPQVYTAERGVTEAEVALR